MALTYKSHEKISLRATSGLSETWLHDQICSDTLMLGLGEVDVLDRERPQISGGRLDMLLSDTENNARYEVEIMLGATDPSHIIRCIEYWDIERRRYPAYDHVAVIVAEEITTRFLNVIALLGGSIPIVAIQLNALKVGEAVLLDFVKVLDQRMLREDDTVETGGGDVDRQWWEIRKGADKVQLCDRFLQLAKEYSDEPLQLKYKKSHISLTAPGSFFHVAVFWPKKNFVRMRFTLTEAAKWVEQLEQAGIEADAAREDRVHLRMTDAEFPKHEKLLREFVKQSLLDSKA